MGIDYESEASPVVHTDVLVVGSGPIGAVYARKLVESGRKVLMVDVGSQETEVPGEHKKNNSEKSLNEFTEVIKQDLDALAPSSSLPGASATRTIGGMSSHWTCATPSPHATLERSKLFTESQWNTLLSEAQTLLNTTNTVFDNSKRHQVIKSLLNGSEDREFTSTPLACTKTSSGEIIYSSTSTILSPILQNPNFTLLPSHLCTKLNKDKNGSKIVSASLYHLESTAIKTVYAKQYVVCAGAVLTPQIIFNSGMSHELPALGKYLTERLLGFGQVTIRSDIPDGEVQLIEGVKEGREWQTMVHREAFQYGETPEGTDEKRVLDVRCMSAMEPKAENKVEFSETKKDQFGMPKPTFTVSPSNADLKRAAKMMQDMESLTKTLGSTITSPTLMPIGTALHISGTTRAGTSREDSVVDKDSKVWGTDNLYLGGCGVIETGMACNPTLTAMCYALAGAEKVASGVF